jgi:transcriptional regulator with XRE-family HTH domain
MSAGAGADHVHGSSGPVAGLQLRGTAAGGGRAGAGAAHEVSVHPVPGAASHREAGHREGDWPSHPDPGDLSRRLAARRAELGLAIGQVAGRARVPARYLEYLENFPALPAPAVLRRLAAALRTTPGALLGAGQEAPAGRAGQAAGTGSGERDAAARDAGRDDPDEQLPVAGSPGLDARLLGPGTVIV